MTSYPPASLAVRCILLAVLILTALLPGVLQAGSDLGPGSAFGRIGRRFTNFLPIPQWSTVLKRYQLEQRVDVDCRRGNCPYTEWQRFLDGQRDKDPFTQVQEVNSFVNRWRYVKDMVNWGIEDYWEVPSEFFEKSGDCEDYAIVKFMSLRALGFDNDVVRLVAVMDLDLKIGHAVTLVDLDGQTLLLDNQIKRVIPASSVHHYKPVFSANETTWWLFK